MPVTSTEISSNYVGNGSTTVPYPITISRDRDEDLKLLVDGVASTDFTVSPDGFRTGVAHAGTVALTLYRETPLTQDQPFPSNTTPAGEDVRAGLDKLTLISQETQSGIGRAIRLKVSEGSASEMDRVPNGTLATDGGGNPKIETAVETVNRLGVQTSVPANAAENFRNAAENFRNAAENFRNEAETFRNEAAAKVDELAGISENLPVTAINLTANKLVTHANGVAVVEGVNNLAPATSLDVDMLGMIPSGWLGIRDFRIYDDGLNFTTAVDSLEGWRDHHRLPEGKVYYVNSATGSDSNDGLTAGTAFATIAKVLTLNDYDTVYVEAGIYERDKGFTVPPNRSSNWIATNGTVFVGSHDYQQVVTAHPTLPNVWQFSRSAVKNICSADPADWDANEVPIPWDRVAAENDVNSANKWHVDGSTVSLYFEGGTAPVFNQDIFVMRDRIHNTISGIGQATPMTIYQEGFHWLGGIEIWGGVLDVKLYFYGCKFTNKMEQTKNIANLRIIGVTDIRFNKCVSAYSWYDNFNYTNGPANPTDPTFLELNCKSYSAGLRGGGSNQASTGHNDYIGLSINSEYSPTTQDAILDVNDSHRLLLAPHFIKEVNKELCLNVSDANTRPSYCIRPRFTGMTNPEFRSHELACYVSQIDPADNVSLRSLNTAWIEMAPSDFEPDFIQPPRKLTKINGSDLIGGDRDLDAVSTGGGSFRVFLPNLSAITSVDIN